MATTTFLTTATTTTMTTTTMTTTATTTTTMTMREYYSTSPMPWERGTEYTLSLHLEELILTFTV
jgi:hypothetical protein